MARQALPGGVKAFVLCFTVLTPIFYALRAAGTWLPVLQGNELLSIDPTQTAIRNVELAAVVPLALGMIAGVKLSKSDPRGLLWLGWTLTFKGIIFVLGPLLTGLEFGAVVAAGVLGFCAWGIVFSILAWWYFATSREVLATYGARLRPDDLARIEDWANTEPSDAESESKSAAPETQCLTRPEEPEDRELAAYSTVAEELRSNERHDGLWLKCVADCGGDYSKAELIYVKARVAMLLKASRIPPAG